MDRKKLQAKLSESLEKMGYYEAKAKLADSDNKESKEKRAYYKGKVDMILELHGYFISSEEMIQTIEFGKLKFANGDDVESY